MFGKEKPQEKPEALATEAPPVDKTQRQLNALFIEVQRLLTLRNDMPELERLKQAFEGEEV